MLSFVYSLLTIWVGMVATAVTVEQAGELTLQTEVVLGLLLTCALIKKDAFTLQEVLAALAAQELNKTKRIWSKVKPLLSKDEIAWLESALRGE